jgi:hypothetical protein
MRHVLGIKASEAVPTSPSFLKAKQRRLPYTPPLSHLLLDISLAGAPFSGRPHFLQEPDTKPSFSTQLFS